MLSVEQYDRSAKDARMGRDAAEAEDLRELFDVAWSNFFTARQHATLVKFFEDQASAVRHEAQRLSSLPGKAVVAEATRVEATRLYETAQHHRTAAEFRQEKAEALMVDASSMAGREAAQKQRRERRERREHHNEDDRHQDDVQRPEEHRAE